jgi:hypothetical protein
MSRNSQDRTPTGHSGSPSDVPPEPLNVQGERAFFSPEHNEWLDNLYGWPAGSALGIFQANAALREDARRLIDGANMRTPPQYDAVVTPTGSTPPPPSYTRGDDDDTDVQEWQIRAFGSVEIARQAARRVAENHVEATANRRGAYHVEQERLRREIRRIRRAIASNERRQRSAEMPRVDEEGANSPAHLAGARPMAAGANTPATPRPNRGDTVFPTRLPAFEGLNERSPTNGQPRTPQSAFARSSNHAGTPRGGLFGHGPARSPTNYPQGRRVTFAENLADPSLNRVRTPPPVSTRQNSLFGPPPTAGTEAGTAIESNDDADVDMSEEDGTGPAPASNPTRPARRSQGDADDGDDGYSPRAQRNRVMARTGLSDALLGNVRVTRSSARRGDRPAARGHAGPRVRGR